MIGIKWKGITVGCSTLDFPMTLYYGRVVMLYAVDLFFISNMNVLQYCICSILVLHCYLDLLEITIRKMKIIKYEMINSEIRELSSSVD